MPSLGAILEIRTAINVLLRENANIAYAPLLPVLDAYENLSDEAHRFLENMGLSVLNIVLPSQPTLSDMGDSSMLSVGVKTFVACVLASDFVNDILIEPPRMREAQLANAARRCGLTPDQLRALVQKWWDTESAD